MTSGGGAPLKLQALHVAKSGVARDSGMGFPQRGQVVASIVFGAWAGKFFGMLVSFQKNVYIAVKITS